LGFSPNQIVFGKLPPSFLSYTAGVSSIAACGSKLQSRDEIFFFAT